MRSLETACIQSAMNSQMRSFLGLLSVFMFQNVNAESDPCITATYLPLLSMRTTNYIPDVAGGEKYMCDKDIIPKEGKWYRVDSNDLVTNETDPFTCGTQNAIWTKEKLPRKQGVVFNLKACLPGVTDACEKELPFKVKKCGTHQVYFLVPPDICPSSYCFGYGDNGHTSSGTSYGVTLQTLTVPAPNVRVNKPAVKHNLIRKKNSRTDTQQLEFVCDFTPQPDKEKYFYQVFWFLDGDLRYSTKVESFSNLNNTNLVEEHHKQLRLMGTNMACGVRLRLSSKGAPGKLSTLSSQLFTGIQVKLTTNFLYRSESLAIALKPTIPFGCAYTDKITDNIRPCFLRIEMFVPRDANVCEGTVAAENIDNCGILISSKEWNKEHFFNITWRDDNMYIMKKNGNTKYVLKFRTAQNINHDLWSFYHLQDIHIHLVDNSIEWKGKLCYAHSDPHFKTFDSRLYDNHKDGTFVMYQNNGRHGRTKMQVQIKVTPCNGAKPRCICAIAVRAGGDVFMIDRCPDKKQHYFGFKSCRDNSLLDVRKESENKYKIYFPSGTRVDIYIHSYTKKDVMEVDIHPSVRDVRMSEGLCGNLNGDEKDDLSPPQHWSVSHSNNLFEMNDNGFHALERWDATESFCTCPSNATELVKEIRCTPDTSVKCNRKDIPVTRKCRINKERSVRSLFRFTPDNYLPSEERHLRLKRQAANAGMPINPNDAKIFCENFMKQSAAFMECSKLSNINPSEAIDTCVLDIQLTNSTEWSDVSRESVKSECIKEVSLNSTFQEESENETSIAQQIKTLYCLNECSKQGVCNNGTCDCDDGFASADCSMNLNDPPIVYGINIDDGGLCETNDCETVFVEGDFFINTQNLTCKLEYFEVSYFGNVSMSNSVTITKAQHNTLADVLCPLTKARKKREIKEDQSFVHGYEMSVSNNGKQFSTKHKLYILDSRCQDTANVSGELVFVLKAGFCFIRGQCIMDGTADGRNPCRICRADQQVLDWSWKDCPGEYTQKDSKLWIIGVVIGCVAILLTVAAGLYIVKIKKQRPNRINSEILGAPKPPPYKPAA